MKMIKIKTLVLILRCGNNEKLIILSDVGNEAKDLLQIIDN